MVKISILEKLSVRSKTKRSIYQTQKETTALGILNMQAAKRIADNPGNAFPTYPDPTLDWESFILLPQMGLSQTLF
jgi:hypothetical protein